jgi:NADH-quinone oxidoreductase subunit N
VNTLVYTSILGLLCLALEILNLRKLLIPFVLVALTLILGANVMEWGNPTWQIVTGIDVSHMMETNTFSAAFSALAIVITGLIIAMSGDFYKKEEHHISDYIAILIFILCGAMVLFGFTNLVMMFLGIEIVSISLYILAGSRKNDVRSNEAGFKYFLMGSFASGILLFGIALMYGAAHSFELSKIAAFAAAGGMESTIFKVGALMTIVALLFKVAAVPFHFWSPDVYEGSPSLVTAFMSTLVKVAIFAGFYKFMAAGISGINAYTEEILIIVAVATMVIGNIIAITQTNFKRLLAYSGISHAGYMLLAILSAKGDTSNALFFYGAVYSLATIGAFAIAIPVFKQREREDVEAFNGLGKTNSWHAALLTMCMLSLGSIPPLAGFIGKYFIFSEAIRNGYAVVTIIAIITSMIGVYYYFKVILAMYTKPGVDEQKIKLPWEYEVVLMICVGASLLLGVWPKLLLGLL